MLSTNLKPVTRPTGTIMVQSLLLLILWLTTTAAIVAGFPASSRSDPRLHRYGCSRQESRPISERHRSLSRPTTLRSAPREEGGDADAVRRQLEVSWNAERMGRVPTTPQAGAAEAGEAIARAVDSRNVGVFFVDVLLPMYDLTGGGAGVGGGHQLYDEVASVDFCIALSRCLGGRTQILVRDATTLGLVEKVLAARERNAGAKAVGESDDPDDPFGDGDDDDYDDDDDDEYDDDILLDERAADVPDNKADPMSSETKSDADSFRQQLSLSWDNDGVTSDDPENRSNPSTGRPTGKSSGADGGRAKAVGRATPTKARTYRLANLFGNADFGRGGPDLAKDVIEAVRQNALAEEDEENVIIMSAVGPDEMIAVRGLVTKYAEEKKVVLVNSKLRPTPTELMSAETAYSILPLMAKDKRRRSSPPDGSLRAGDDEDASPPPKVVVMRRYPRDWEVFIDVGNGFDLAETKPVNQSNKRGLPMEWVAGCVERYLQSVTGRR